MEDTRFNYLFERYHKGLATPKESNEFLDVVENEFNKERIQGLMEVYWNSFSSDESVFFSETQRDRMFTAIFNADRVAVTKTTHKLWPRIAGVAAAVAVIVSSIYFFNYKGEQNTAAQTETVSNVIKPGHNGATLTLANGKEIKLSDAVKGELAKEAGVVISKSADGKLVYEITGNTNDPNKINKLSTAKGETYQVRLPDGSLVALNAASSLEYPANFSAMKDRRVKLTGEGYFEIAKDKAHPFIVKTDRQEVEVLGTHFNINSYSDEPTVNTTLLEGSVKINQHTILKPGERAMLNKSGNIRVAPADPDAVAWKDGKFRFNNTSLESVLRQLSRWYDVDIKYQGGIPDEKFTGGIDRNINASEALDILKYMKVNFKIEGKTIIVTQ